MTETEEMAAVERILSENEKIFKAALDHRKKRKDIERYLPALLTSADAVRRALLQEAAEESAEESRAELLLRYRLEAFSAAWGHPESAEDVLRFLAAEKEAKQKKKAKKKQDKKAKKEKNKKKEKKEKRKND